MRETQPLIGKMTLGLLTNAKDRMLNMLPAWLLGVFGHGELMLSYPVTSPTVMSVSTKQRPTITQSHIPVLIA